jgi:hypothetical protein
LGIRWKRDAVHQCFRAARKPYFADKQKLKLLYVHLIHFSLLWKTLSNQLSKPSLLFSF